MRVEEKERAKKREREKDRGSIIVHEGKIGV